MDLKGRVALITGGGTGLGKVVSLRMAREGADVAIGYSRSEVEANETADEVRSLGRRAHPIQADVASSQDVRRMIAEVARELGRIDVLINDAGTTVFIDFKKLDEVTEESWDRIMAVNVKGAFLCSQAVAPIMKAQGFGRIVNITSVAGLRAGGSSIPYSVSKAAETMLTKCLATALGPEIAVNAVAPGLMDTRWGRIWGQTALDAGAQGALLQRLPGLDDVADAVLFVAKNDSMTGQSVVVDAGRLLH